MKKHRFYGGLFVTPLHITTSSSYLTIKNTPPLEQANPAQDQLLTTHTTLNEKYKTNISGLLSFPRLWNSHRPDRKIIRLRVYIEYT